ncbi:competence protein ComK [Aquibacillus saliphilus]|uniref:competence protein ComK n=1 Tax=Aquibacillus saliphilus TaxID=1909422 RepID=UPI001CF0CC37|nr:competence protein ComK [Aquibacillus saliphilus]
MTEILSNYDINERTMAILPSFQIDYDAIVIEPGRKLFVKKMPMELIRTACLEGGASYEGRRTAVMYKTESRQKVPIPVNPSMNIYTFPTHSPSQFECSWIFFNHVKSAKPYYSVQKTNPQSTIIFKNGQQLILNQSYYMIEKQMQRTALCMLRFSAPTTINQKERNIPLELY